MKPVSVAVLLTAGLAAARRADPAEPLGEHLPGVVETALDYLGRAIASGADWELALDPEGLKTFARQRLTRYKVPRDFYHFERLERDQTGKIRRWEVRDTLLSLLTQP